jgi:hypothetical protein
VNARDTIHRSSGYTSKFIEKVGRFQRDSAPIPISEGFPPGSPAFFQISVQPAAPAVHTPVRRRKRRRQWLLVAHREQRPDRRHGFWGKSDNRALKLHVNGGRFAAVFAVVFA